MWRLQYLGSSSKFDKCMDYLYKKPVRLKIRSRVNRMSIIICFRSVQQKSATIQAIRHQQQRLHGGSYGTKANPVSTSALPSLISEADFKHVSNS